jgi:hypothetical protein
MRHKMVPAIAVLALAAVLLLSRWPLIPSSLPNFDAANFAFALEHFNPVVHSPQPPGYPLYVGLSNVIHWFVDDVVRVFIIAGLIAMLVALLALAYLAQTMGGVRPALVATTLLLLHPAGWTAGILNPVRLFLAAGSAVVALLAWKSWNPGSRRVWFVSAWMTLGISAGFRPTLAILLLPLCVAAGIRRRSTLGDWGLALLACLGICAGWVAACVYPAGGISQFVSLMQAYLKDQSSSSSIFYGASPAVAGEMAGKAIVWAAAPAVCWVWALLLVPRHTLIERWRSTGSFFLLWTLPALLLYTLLHSAQPGHILLLVVPLSLLGGLACGDLLRNGRRTAAMIALVAGWNLLLFVRPPIEWLRPASLRTILQASRPLNEFRSVVDRLAAREPITLVVAPSAPVSWRRISYYYRDHPVIVLHSSMGSGGAPDYWVVRHNNIEAWGPGRVPIRCGKVIWFVGERDLPFLYGGSPVALERVGPVLIFTPPSRAVFRVAEYTFQTRASSPLPNVRSGRTLNH